jgi:hypothetical protein
LLHRQFFVFDKSLVVVFVQTVAEEILNQTDLVADIVGGDRVESGRLFQDIASRCRGTARKVSRGLADDGNEGVAYVGFWAW